MRLRFAGQYYDEETGLHYNYFREYNPRVGQYTQSDPLGLTGGLATYGYTLANPLRYTDPLGLAIDCDTLYYPATRRTFDQTENLYTFNVEPGIGLRFKGIGVGPKNSLLPPRRTLPIAPEIEWEVWLIWRQLKKDATVTYQQITEHMIILCTETYTDECGKEQTRTYEPRSYDLAHDPVEIARVEGDWYFHTVDVMKLY